MASTADTRVLIHNVLQKASIMSLATVDDGGVWVADVIYVHDNDFTLYWMSDPNVRHSRAIDKNPEVAVTITLEGDGKNNLGLQIAGRAEKIEGHRYDLAVKHCRKRQKPEPKESEDVLRGDSWYQLKPQIIELIHEKFYGEEKQQLRLR